MYYEELKQIIRSVLQQGLSGQSLMEALTANVNPTEIYASDAIDKGKITFYGVWKDNTLIGCCSITVGFSTFDYHSSGVFEDFYICPEHRHQGIARQLVEFAYHESGVSSLTVGCADCDVKMYQSLGFAISLGNLLAFE